RAAPPRFGSSILVSGAETVPAAQHAPRVAARGSHVFVVWHEAAAGGLENVFLGIGRRRGDAFAAPIRVSDNPAGTVVETHPTVAVRGGTIYVAWQEFAAGRDDTAGRIKLARFNVRGKKRGPDVRVDDADGAGKWLPALALVGPDPVVAWIDERDVGPEGAPFEHVYAARGTSGGTAFG